MKNNSSLVIARKGKALTKQSPNVKRNEIASVATLPRNDVAQRRYPPEWEKQSCVWLPWPHNKKEWGKKRLQKIQEFYIKLISLILDFQNVNLILPDEKTLLSVETCYGKSLQRKKHKLYKIIIPNNDIWIRDYGPFFMKSNVGTLHATSLLIGFEFNSWGGKFPPWNLDNKVPKEISKYLGCELESYPIVMEGGALEFNGDGVLMTTEQRLLNRNRNPQLNKNQIESILKSAFNIEAVIWLKCGLEGDHTDGHIDDVARFIGPKKIVICSTDDKKDANYKHLKESIEYLKKWKHPKQGYKLEIIKIPLPNKMVLKGKRLPNSYANFIFVNGGIIVSLFNCETDENVLGAFTKLFPKRKIVGIDCSLLLEEGGGLHCMTKQESSI